MARPKKCRKVSHEPEFCKFFADGIPPKDTVNLTIDEYEVIRILDYEEKKQCECASIMGVARTTITQIYNEARKKIADSIVNGKTLNIVGGKYQLDIENNQENQTFIFKGAKSMRIAVTHENGQVFQHFGHSKEFKIYDVENDVIVKEEVVNTNGSGHGALANFLAEQHVDSVICGGIGGGAQTALAEKGIKIFGGVTGETDAVAKALVAGTLEYNPNVRCNHHDHEHGEGHTCGDHGCGSHSCGSTSEQKFTLVK